MSGVPYLRPRSLAEALRQRADHPEATVLAGGTDVFVAMDAGQLEPRAVIDLWGLPELRTISGERIGALATWTDVRRCDDLPAALRECALTVGARQIQNRGTVGGNIVNASPAGDSLPLWLVLDATFELASTRGTRSVPARSFWQGYRKTALAPDELLVAVSLPSVPGAVSYRKVGTRLAQAISKVVFAGRLSHEAGVVADVAIAFGSVAPVPVRCRGAESALRGRPLDADSMGDAVRALEGDIAPIDDVRSTARYRARVAERLLQRWLAARDCSPSPNA